MASTAAATSSRSSLRAVSATFTWSEARAASNSVWSIGKRGGVSRDSPSPSPRARRYSSRAAAWSSGKPSKPSAWANLTTVELDVLARRASSSAVWKAASSRWSTMYCATSFCEREHSSKRARMYLDRLWCSLVTAAWPLPCGEREADEAGLRAVCERPLAGRGRVVGVAARFIGALVRRRRLALLPDRVSGHAPRAVRGRARRLPRELPHVPRARGHRR